MCVYVKNAPPCILAHYHKFCVFRYTAPQHRHLISNDVPMFAFPFVTQSLRLLVAFAHPEVEFTLFMLILSSLPFHGWKKGWKVRNTAFMARGVFLTTFSRSSTVREVRWNALQHAATEFGTVECESSGQKTNMSSRTEQTSTRRNWLVFFGKTHIKGRQINQTYTYAETRAQPHENARENVRVSGTRERWTTSFERVPHVGWRGP